MNIRDYQLEARKTAIYRDKIEEIAEDIIDNHKIGELVDLLSFCYTVLGLVGEAGEIANKAKKIIRDKGGVITNEIRNDFISEIGDVEWYTANLATELGVESNDILGLNLSKLFSRMERNKISGEGDKR